MWQKLLVNVIMALLAKLGAWLLEQAKKAKKLGGISKRVKKQVKKVEDAKTPEDIKAAHRNSDRI